MNPAALLLLKRWWPGLAAILVIVVFVPPLAYCKGQSVGRSGEVLKQQEREIETQRDLGQANEKAADQRLQDAAKSVAQYKELSDALKATSDPDHQRAMRGCIILRQQGRDVSHLPACR